MQTLLVVACVGIFAFGSTDAFVFNKSNEFNYSYPSSKWTYVPCVMLTDCWKFTGDNKYCYKSELGVGGSVCTCLRLSG